MLLTSSSVAAQATYPPNLGRTIIQAQEKTADPEEHTPTVVQLLNRMAFEEGVMSLYRGLLPDLVQGVMDAAIMMMIKEKIDATVKRGALGIK
jgi:hypothetical protein